MESVVTADAKPPSTLGAGAAGGSLALGRERAEGYLWLGASILQQGSQHRWPSCLSKQGTQLPLVVLLGELLPACVPDSPLPFTKPEGKREEHGEFNTFCKYSWTRKTSIPQFFLSVKCLASRSQPMTNDTQPCHQLSSLCWCTPLLDTVFPSVQIWQGAMWMLLLQRNFSGGEMLAVSSCCCREYSQAVLGRTAAVISKSKEEVVNLWLSFEVRREHKACYKLTTKSEYIK